MVERQVRRRELQRRCHVASCIGDRLLRQCEHQVQVHVAEDHQRRLGGAPRFVTVVDTAERMQEAVIETLDAERQTVHARGEEAGEFRALEGSRIGLERDFRVGRERDARTHGRQQPIDRLRREEARRAAADEHRADLAAPDRRQRTFEIGDQCVDVGVLGQRFRRRMRIEIAIRDTCCMHHGMCTYSASGGSAVNCGRAIAPAIDPRDHRRSVRRVSAHRTLRRRFARSGCASPVPRCDSSFFRSSGNSAPVSPVCRSSKCGS